jgi:hypothetical protein
VWLLAGAALFYAFRVWTYLYFSPHILDLVANAPTGTPTPEYLDAVRQWLFLNWFRIENPLPRGCLHPCLAAPCAAFWRQDAVISGRITASCLRHRVRWLSPRSSW